MKLIDILVGSGDGMSLFGVHTKYLAMDPDGRVHGYCEMPSPTVLGWGIPDALYSTDGRGCLIQIDRDDVDGQWQSAIITREQYEAALAAKNEGWIEWGGGKHPPVSANTVVDVKIEKGYVQSGYPAGEYSWEHVWRGSNIIAYRLHKPQEVEMIPLDECDGSRVEDDLNECIGQDVAPVWSGEGLPPVGMKIEWLSDKYGWLGGTVAAHDAKHPLIAIIRHNDGYTGCHRHELRTEADKKRHKSLQAIYEILDAGTSTKQDAADIYDAIAAGKIPGVKLDN